jgi:hypothetical protein
MRRLLVVCLLVALLTAGGSLAGARERRGFAQGQFATPCRYTHSSMDDPIVYPRRPGLSHRHDFFGNASTNAYSTRASLLRASTTCRRGDDRAAYWVPSLFKDGRVVVPIRAQVYYRTAGRDPRTIRAFPAGLKVIAGNAHARRPQDTRVVSWHCGPRSGMRPRSSVPTCPAGARLRLRVRFPDCWDGRRLDSAEHRSHMAYSRRHRCPRSHPVAVPRLVVNIVYPIAGGSGVTLASGPAYTAHADFVNAWRQPALVALVRRCLNRARHCGRR